MRPTPDEALTTLGSTIRAARRARGLTQQRTAREADVSRAQLALLEKGENVSVKFLLKIARFLELTDIPLDGVVRLTSTSGPDGVNVAFLLQAVDILGALVEQLRAFAVNALLPPAGRTKLDDTPAVRAFLARHVSDAEGLTRLSEAILQLAKESRPPVPPAVRDDEAQKPLRRERTKDRAK